MLTFIFFVNSRSEKTKCKHMDDCTEDAFCNGRNATCPNPDPKPDNVTECNQGTQVCSTDKSFSEVLILASTNPQYDKRLFIELKVQYMKIASSEHVYLTCSECQNKNKKTICVMTVF